MPDAAALNLCARLEPWELYCFAYPHQAHRSTTKRILEFLNSPNGDLRHLENLLIDSKAKITLGDYRDHTERAHRPGDTLKKWLIQNYSPPMDCLVELPQASVWPYLATHLDIFEEVLGLKSGERFNFDKVKTLTALQLLPAIPAHFLGPLLEIATGSTRTAQDQARELLVDVHEIDARLITLLDDTRQAIRAGTAEWLAARGNTAAVGPLESRLKKEKSELARAAILTALTKLGSDIITHIGPQALADEALKGLKSAKLDKLDWLQLDNLPKATYVEGEQVPDNVLCYWIHLAVKLKQPGGNTLFEIYLDRLAPASAETFSTWVLDSWINYDTVRPSDEQANEYAAAHAQDRHESYVQYDPEYTLEKAIAELKTEVKGQYYHSGAASKGLLALATKAPPELVADRVRSYLKKHGRRTSQASSLLELAAAISHPTTLQAIIAAATRLRQKGVQAFAEELVQKVAEQHDWTLDELGDRTVPSAGLEDDGTLMLPCGQDEKPYLARLDDTFKLIVLNPAGKKISSLPAGTDDATKASRKRLSAARKELKQVIALQSARLYEALCAERIWPIEDWKRDLAKHPLMGQLIQRVVWIGLDEQDEVQTSFRPTAEGDFTDTSDNPIDLTPFAAVRIAHAALLDEAQGAAWLTHFTDYEVPPLIAQFGKTLLKLDDTKEAQAATEILDRKGWLSDTFTVRGAAMQLGYERGQAMDSGCFFNYQKPFKSAGLIAVVDFTGSFLPEENIPASIINLHFEKSDYGNRTVPLGDVPPVLLSECWNDLHLIAAKATFDPDWEKKSAW